MFKIFDKWFSYFRTNKIPIPANVDIHIVMNIMVVLFNTQESLAITTSIYFWYEYCSMFNAEVNSYFLNIIVKFYFFKLLLNWSKNVREAFLYFICFKVLFMFECGLGNELFNSLLVTINQYLNVAKKTNEIYTLNQFNHGRLPKKERKKVSLKKLREGVANQIDSFDKKVLDTNFFWGTTKFEGLFSRYLQNFIVVNDYFSINDKKVDDINQSQSADVSVEEVDLMTKSKFNKLRFMRLNSLHMDSVAISIITENDLPYCSAGIADFKSVYQNYIKFKGESAPISLDELPKLKMRLPIDEFEFMEGSEWEW